MPPASRSVPRSVRVRSAIAREVRAGQFCCARIEGHELVRETGWVYARANRVPRMINELIEAFEEIRGRLQLAPRKQ